MTVVASWATLQAEVVTRRGSVPAFFADAEAGAHQADVIALTVGRPAGAPGPNPGPEATALAVAYGVDLERVIAGEKVSGTTGEIVRVPVLAPAGLPARFLLVGIGTGSVSDLRRAGAALGRATRGRQHLATTLGNDSGAEGVRGVIEGLLLGGYATPASGLRSRSEQQPAGRITLVGTYPPAAIDQGLAHARATILARDLAETPSNLKSPAWLAEQARELGLTAGLAVEVWDEDRLRADGFGGVLAVGSGSATPPRFVRLDYRPEGLPPGRAGRANGAKPAGRAGSRAAASARPIVLAGKGITYDTGGISIKPREGMVPMKTDMSGAAAVLATLVHCRDLGVRRPVIGLLPLAENAFGASSYRPGDIVTVHGGRTVEILNTDAEGRMVLADALAYAAGTLDPEIIVDVATLTGAATLGLGRRHSALYATDDQLAAAFTEAGTSSGEHVWRMPLVEDYREVLDSPIADLRHVPGRGGSVGAGSITAALFLREFVGAHRWAHLDIAGTARSEREEYEITRGATGYGARLLLRWLESLR